MPNTREKLIDLISTARFDVERICNERMDCEDCPAAVYEGECKAGYIADHLIANGVTVQQWIPVTERLPDNKEHDWVLAQVVEDNGYMHIPKVMEYRQALNDWYEETYGWLSKHNGALSVTHWMPLPEPPKP